MIILQICPVVRWRFYIVKKKLDLPGKSFDLVNQSENHFISYKRGSLLLYNLTICRFYGNKIIHFFILFSINQWNPQKGFSPQKNK